MTWLANPRAFNYLIIGLFLCAAIRWGCFGNWKQVIYWIAAAALNIATIPTEGK